MRTPSLKSLGLLCAVACAGCGENGLPPGDAGGAGTGADLVDDVAMLVDLGQGPDAGACSCTVASCGKSVCGRSACGYLCGACPSGSRCSAGACQVGVPPGVPCTDAWGSHLWDGDRGFRACPTDPARQQACICAAGNWGACDPTCSKACDPQPANTIACGPLTCDATSQVCCSTSATAHSCGAAPCPSGWTRRCDGPEDCGGLPCCGGDYPWTSYCVGSASCGSLDQFCHTQTDCPTARPYCCPLAHNDLRGCSANPAPECN
jgi:hypothetical protein